MKGGSLELRSFRPRPSMMMHTCNLSNWKVEDQEVKANLSYVVISRPTWITCGYVITFLHTHMKTKTKEGVLDQSVKLSKVQSQK